MSNQLSQLLHRRDAIRALLGAGAFSRLSSGAAPVRKIGIIGGGMAGVSLGWLLDGHHQVTLLEASGSIGGNIQSTAVELDGVSFVVDMGAQFFHPGPYPVYTELLQTMGLYPPAPKGQQPGTSHSFPTSITVHASSEVLPRFVSPVPPDRLWPVLAPWNTEGLQAFAKTFAAAKQLEENDASWNLTLEDWLKTLDLSFSQREGMILPWAASLYSGSIEQARGMSARAAMIFVAKALPENSLQPPSYYVLNDGMAEPLRRMVREYTTTALLTGAAVTGILKNQAGSFEVQCADGRKLLFDDLVFACSAPTAQKLLSGIPGTQTQQAALSGIEYHDARLALHTDGIYASRQTANWSFLNCEISGSFCEASMWMADVLAIPPRTTAAKLWKSWVTHRDRQPAQVLHEVQFRHMLPTPLSIRSQRALLAQQGKDRIWFVGGYTRPYDSQETALVSAMTVSVSLTSN